VSRKGAVTSSGAPSAQDCSREERQAPLEKLARAEKPLAGEAQAKMGTVRLLCAELYSVQMKESAATAASRTGTAPRQPEYQACTSFSGLRACVM
jgi:hypothetical protein